MNYNEVEIQIPSLGPAKIPSPLQKLGAGPGFVPNDHSILIETQAGKMVNAVRDGLTPPSFELAGPRSHIYFDPYKLRYHWHRRFIFGFFPRAPGC